jgi:hypothetical protein
MLVQLGLLDPPALPVCGAEQSARVLDPPPSEHAHPQALAFGLFAARLARRGLCRGWLARAGTGNFRLLLKNVHQPWKATPAPQPRATQ